MITINPRTDALIVVDAQPTFMPGGGLAVAYGDQIIPVIKRLLPLFPRRMRLATKDRHPRGHVSLASSYVDIHPFDELTYDRVARWSEDANSIGPNAKFTLAQLKDYMGKVYRQMLWPDHSIDGTVEAELHPELPEDLFDFVQVKGMDPACDSYSGFRDNLKRPTGLDQEVKKRLIRRAFYVGLAGDYCVGATAVDGTEFGVQAYVIRDGVRDVNSPGSVEAMQKQFRDHGVRVVDSNSIHGI